MALLCCLAAGGEVETLVGRIRVKVVTKSYPDQLY